MQLYTASAEVLVLVLVLVFTKTTKSRKNLKKSAADRRSVRSGANKTNTMAVLKKRALAEYSQVVQV
jgi:hypothetical protein